MAGPRRIIFGSTAAYVAIGLALLTCVVAWRSTHVVRTLVASRVHIVPAPSTVLDRWCTTPHVDAAESEAADVEWPSDLKIRREPTSSRLSFAVVVAHRDPAVVLRI